MGYRGKIGLFIPCYVNTVFPEVGIATYKLLTHLGIDVDYPVDQTCCGQPMANAGFEEKSIPLIHKFNELFDKYDYVVGPSASCVAFVKENHPHILEAHGQHACQMSGKIYEVCEFLHDIVKVEALPGAFPHKVSVHNSCHGVRELHLSSPSELHRPRYSKIKDLLSLKEGVEVFEPQRVDECCGFGGMFAVEEDAVSVQMGKDKLRNHMATGAEFVTGADSSCLMHMQGIARRENLPIQFIHVVEILAAGL